MNANELKKNYPNAKITTNGNNNEFIDAEFSDEAEARKCAKNEGGRYHVEGLFGNRHVVTFLAE